MLKRQRNDAYLDRGETPQLKWEYRTVRLPEQEPRKWEPSWNLPQFPSEKWELTYLGPGGLASVFCLP